MVTVAVYLFLASMTLTTVNALSVFNSTSSAEEFPTYLFSRWNYPLELFLNRINSILVASNLFAILKFYIADSYVRGNRGYIAPCRSTVPNPSRPRTNKDFSKRSWVKRLSLFIHSFIHSFIPSFIHSKIYIAPLQWNYSEALPSLVRKRGRFTNYLKSIGV